MKKSAMLAGWIMLIAGALAIAAVMNGQPPVNSAQVTVLSSTAKVVVVVIPGFPIESIILGSLLGLILLMILRRKPRTTR